MIVPHIFYLLRNDRENPFIYYQVKLIYGKVKCLLEKSRTLLCSKFTTKLLVDPFSPLNSFSLRKLRCLPNKSLRKSL